MSDKLEALSQPDYTRYDCGSCGHETLYVQHKNICPVCSHRPMSETHLYSQEYVTALLQDISNLEQAMRHIHGAALDITVPRAAIAKAAEFATKGENRNA